MALLEVCCGNPESVDAAVLGGARRIELCADLEADGLTPPTAWIRAAKARYPSLTVHVLIRPRAGDFVYSPAEADVMAGQIEEALDAGADGIVLGALTPEGDVDLPLTERLVALIDSYKGCALLGELRRRARGRIGILPGGGVTPGNAARILERTGCTEIHASASVTRDGKKVTDAGRVAEILRAING